MGRIKHQRVRELFDKSPVVSFSSIERALGGYSKQLIRNLLAGGKIKRLGKGCYTKYDEASLAVYCLKPAYLGLQDALSFYELWEQEAIPVILTAGKARNGVRKVMGTNILIRRIDRKYLFGFEYKKEGELYLPYSDIEKTFIDMIYFDEHMDDDVIKNFKKRIEKKKLLHYLKKYPTRFRKRVLNLMV
jgi:predicted transcriptional regulator of viral defense system